MSKLYDKAAEAVKKRNYDYAIELFLQELTLEPNNVDARRALRAAEIKKYQELGGVPTGGATYVKGLGSMFQAFLYKVTKNWEKEMIACERFLSGAPKNATFLGMLGDAARAAGHIDTAILAFEELREADHASPRALRSLGQLYREKGDIARSMHYYEALRKQLPNDPEAAKAVRDLAAAGATKLAEEKQAAGDGTYRDLMKDEDHASRLEKQSKRIRTESDMDDAIARARADLQKTPHDVKLLKVLGDLFLKKKDYGAAIEAYEEALKKKPNDVTISEAMGDLKMRRYDEQVAELTAQAKKGDADAKGQLKALKDERNDFCIEELTRRVKAHPTELALRFQLGQFLYKGDRLDEAIAELQKAVSDPRRKQQAQLLLGKCFARKKMPELAIKELEKARHGMSGMDETGKEITYELALLYEAAGQRAKAAEEFERIIEVDINYKDAMKRMEALKSSAA